MRLNVAGIGSRVRTVPVKIRLLLSYIAIFVLPLLIGSALILPWIERTERSKISVVLQDLAIQIASLVNEEFTELREYAELFSESQIMGKLMYMQGDKLDLERFPSLLMLSDYNHQFSVFAATKNSVRNLDVILNTKDTVFTSGLQIGNIQLVANAMFGPDAGKHAWFEALVSEKHTATIVYPVNLISRAHENSMFFLVSLPIERSLPVLCTFVYEIDVEYVVNLTRHARTGGGIEAFLSYSSRDGGASTVIQAIPSNAVQYQHHLSSFVKMESDQVHDVGSRLAVTTPSGISGLSVNVLGGKRELFSELRSAKLVLLLAIVLILIVGFILSEYFTNRNWKPLRRILELIEHEVDVSIKGINEYELIETSLQRIIAREDDLKLNIESRRPQLTKYFLKKIIEMPAGTNALPSQEMTDLGITFPYRYHLCLICTAADGSAYLESLLSNTIGTSDATYYLLEYPGYTCGVLNYANGGFMTTLTDAVQTETVKKGNRAVHFAVGTEHTSLDGIHDSYNAAMSVIDYQRLNGDYSIITYEPIRYTRDDYYYPLDKELAISNCLKAGQLEDARKLFLNCVDVNHRYKNISPNSVLNFYHNAHLSCLRVINELGLEVEIDRNYEGFQHSKTHKELQEIILNTFVGICGGVTSRHSTHTELLRNRMVSYIDLNYVNTNLSLHTLSRYLSLSAAHVSRLIHKLFSVGFPDLLNQRRIRAAKELLAGPEDTIEHIAHLSGYSNTTSFTRSFKRIEGITPGKYRSVHGPDR